MKTQKEISQRLGRTRQMIDYIIKGQRNCSYRSAKQFITVLGGDIETWLDDSRTDERRRLYEAYRASD